jgi:teichuronic acid biosynthesis glycosyltransferase TuaG
MDATPVISVPITVYRCPAMLLQSAGSVLAQTYRNLELLIGVNLEDAEGPQLLRAAEHLQSLDSRVRIVDCAGCHDGFAKAVRTIEACQTEWVSGLDYDDLWYPDKLARQLPFLAQYDVVSTGGCYFGDKHDVIDVPHGRLNAGHFRRGNPVMSTSAIMRREDVLKLDPAYRDWAFDYKLYVDLWNAGKKFYALPEVLTLHRLHAGSTYNTHDRSEVLAKIQALVRG